MSRIAASPQRASWPPESVVVSRSSSAPVEPEPVEHRRRPGVEVGAAERRASAPAPRRTRRRRRPRRRRGRRTAAVSAWSAAATPVRRARYSRSVSPARRSRSCGSSTTVAERRRHGHRAGLGRQVAGDQARAASTCRRRSGPTTASRVCGADRDGDVGEHGVRPVREADRAQLDLGPGHAVEARHATHPVGTAIARFVGGWSVDADDAVRGAEVHRGQAGVVVVDPVDLEVGPRHAARRASRRPSPRRRRSRPG